MSNWQEGNYDAVTKAATVYEKNSKLLLAVAFDVSGTTLKSYSVLIEPDGAVNTRTVDRLREWSGWDGVDPYWFVEAAKAEIPVEVAIKLEPGFKEPSKLFPKIQWVNKAGGGGGGALPEMADRRAMMAKYGAKFRAVAGPQPLTAPAKPQRATPPPRAPSTAAPVPPRQQPSAGSHATLDECWKLMQERHAGLNPDALAEKWYAVIDATGMDQADMTPEGWDRVKASILSETSEAQPETEDGEPMPF